MKILLTILIITSSIIADVNPLFPVMYETSSSYSQAFHGAGSALLDGPLGQTLNPATIQAWHRVRQKKIAVSAGYMSDGIDANKFGGGASAVLSPKSVLAAEYLYYMSNNREPDSPAHRATLSYSSTAFGAADDDGGTLNYGVNVSYYNNNGVFSADDSLSHITYADSLQNAEWILIDSGKYQNSGYKNINRKFNQVSGDIGFYQLDEQKGLSFSVVFENILGYSWYSKSHIKEVTSSDTTYNIITPDTTYNNVVVTRDSTVYIDKEKKGGDWVSGKYKSILVGGASIIPLAGEKLLLNIPVDVRFWGFGDKYLRDHSDFKHRVEIHTGLELYMGPMISGRFGYSWVERDLHTDEDGNPVFNPTHRISGGASLAIKFIMLEVAWRKETFGGGVQFMF
jgi:hypothetical protein